MNQYTIKDLLKALNHMQEKIGASNIILEVDDMGRIKMSTHDISSNHVLITVYRANDEQSTKMPEIQETRRL